MPALDTRPARRLVPFLVAGVGFLLTAAELALAGLVADVPLGDWLALHLALAGGVSLLIIGAAQFFACAALATDPPGHRLIAAQAICWTAGAVAMVLGAQLHVRGAMVAAGWLCGVSLALFVAGLRGMERRSLQRAPWATRWHYAGAGFLAAGGLLGVEMWRGAAIAPA
jgi:hypothetical protein